MSTQVSLGDVDAAEELEDEAIREHYRRIRPVFRALGDSCGLRTLGVADLKRWYLSEKIDEGDPLAERWEYRRRPTGLYGDADALAEKLERSYYAVLNYQEPEAIRDAYRPARYEVDYSSGETETRWDGNEHPLPRYPDVKALALFADIDIRDEAKERPLPPEKREAFEDVIERHVDVLADLLGGREHVYVLDSVGGAYVFTAPQVTAPIGERFDGQARGHVFETLADRAREWLGPRFDAIHRGEGTAEWSKTDVQISRSRQYKGPLSLHTSIDGVVVPIDTEAVRYEFTAFDDVDEELLADVLEWCDRFTAPIADDAPLEALVGTLFEEHAPVAPAQPETLEEHIDVVADEEIPGKDLEGDVYDRRCEQFREAIGLARERLVAQRAELIHELYGEDQVGYSDPAAWYQHTVERPLRELVERADEIERADGVGIRWAPAFEDAETLEEHVECVAAGIQVDDYSPERLEQRREQFRAAVEYIREHGTANKRDLVAELYTGDEGYSAAHPWYIQVVCRPIHRLEERTDAIVHDRGPGHGEFRCPEGITDPDELDTFAEHVEHVVAEEIPGRGELLEWRKELFRACLKFLREQGTTSRAQLVDEFCPPDCAGYGEPFAWYRYTIRDPLRTLAERTGAIERAQNEIRWLGTPRTTK